MKTKKHSLFTQYLSLYIITALIPVLTICPLLFLSYHALKTETLYTNTAAVHTIQKSLDTKFEELDKMLICIGTNSSLTSYSLKNKPIEAISTLQKIVSQQDFVNDILIMENNNDYIYSSTGRYFKDNIVQDYMTDLLKKGYSYEEWISQFQKSTASYWPINNFENLPDYLYLFSPVYALHESLISYTETSYPTSRTVALLINRDIIQNLFCSSQTNMDENILLLDHDMNLLCMLVQNSSLESAKTICNYLKTNPDFFENNNGYIKLNENLFFITRSDDTGLCYVRFLPCKIAYQTIDRIRTYTLIILSIAILVGIILISFSMKRSYTPIHSLADWAQNHMPANITKRTEETQNELSLFQSILSHSFEENLSLTQTLNDSKQGMIDYLLTALICGNFTTEEAFHNACHNLGISLEHQYFCVCSVIFENADFNHTTSDFEKLENCILEAFPTHLTLQMKNLLFANRLLLVCNSDSNNIVALTQAVTDCKQHLLEQMNLHISVGIGDFYNSYDKVGKSYLDSVNALDYRLIYGKDCIITPGMYHASLGEKNYPNTDLELLRSALLSQNTELATSAIEHLSAYTKASSSDLHIAKYICYDCFSILRNIPLFADNGYSSSLSTSLNIMHLSNFETIDDFFASFSDIIQNTFGKTSAPNTTPTNLEGQLIDYIHAHCFSYDFQISNMAEYFSISPQHMRKLFKNHTGISISEYIQNLKLKRAMQLLSETDMLLQDIVLEIGNSDVSGFVRSFKQKTGMTPGQYRTSCKQK